MIYVWWICDLIHSCITCVLSCCEGRPPQNLARCTHALLRPRSSPFKCVTRLHPVTSRIVFIIIFTAHDCVEWPFIRRSKFECVRVCVSVRVCVCARECVCACVCMCAHTGRQRGRGVCCSCIGSASQSHTAGSAHLKRVLTLFSIHRKVANIWCSRSRFPEIFVFFLDTRMCAWVCVWVFTGDSPCAKPTLSTCSGTNTASIMNPDVAGWIWTWSGRDGRLLISSTDYIKISVICISVISQCNTLSVQHIIYVLCSPDRGVRSSLDLDYRFAHIVCDSFLRILSGSIVIWIIEKSKNYRLLNFLVL